MEIRTLKGPAQIIPAIPHIARLRLTVFHEWPYLYNGTMEEEEVYLKHFAQSDFACVGLVEHEGEIVGATTAEPFKDTHADFRAPFDQAGIDTSKIFYFGESVLLPEYRGHGVGHAFFDIRESAAWAWGADKTAFCAVQRPDAHPLKPDDYRPLDAFWQSRGYERRNDLVCAFKWKDRGDQAQTEKNLTFWLHKL